MKDIKVTLEEARAALSGKGYTKEGLDEILTALLRATNDGPKWWVIALKTLAYLIGLLLAGMGTAKAANILSII